MPPQSPSAAAIYGRISDDRRGDALGVTRQRSDCEKLAASRDGPVAGYYIDNDISAFSGKHRPEYQRMLQDLKDGTIDAVIAWHPDRLTRNLREIEEFIDVIEATGALVATCTSGDYDLSTADGRFMARIICSVARKESEDKSRRITRKHQELAENGLPHGGIRAFGYEQDYVTVRESEAELIREGVARIIAGDALHAIARDWRDRGVPTVKGGVWAPTGLARILTSWRIAGMRVHKGEPVGEAVWPAIVPLEDLEQVRAILSDPSRTTRPTRSVRKYPLSGYIYCGVCGLKMATARSAGTYRYMCRGERGGCGQCIHGPGLTERVIGAFLLRADTPALQALLHGTGPALSSVDQLQAAEKVERLEAQLAELAKDHYVDRLLEKAEYLAAREPLQRQLTEARELVARRKPLRALHGIDPERSLKEVWPELTVQRQHTLLGVLIDRVVIGPASSRRFQPERISVRWRA